MAAQLGLTRLDLFGIGRDYTRSRAKRLDPGMIDVEGSDINLFVGSSSVLAYAVNQQLLYGVGNLFLDSADDDGTDRLAWDRYRMTRKGASAALGNVRIYRPTFTAGGFTIPSGTKLVSKTGIEYITTENAFFGASSLTATNTSGSTSIKVRAVQAGKANQVGANNLTSFSTAALASFVDKTVLVNNDAATAGGEDREALDDFKNRIRDFWNAARRGTLGAIEFGAKTVPGVVSAHAYEVTEFRAEYRTSTPIRLVVLYIADSSGVSSDALAEAVKIALTEYRAGGIAVLIYTSTPFLVDIPLLLAFATGVDTSVLGQKVRQAVTDFINSLGVGEYLYKSDLLAVLAQYKSEGLVVDSSSVGLAGDIVPELNQTIKTTFERVTLTAA